MTDEQIKQNALKAEKEYGNFNYQYQGEAFNKGYIAGAHSRDEEITRLSAEIENDNYVISKLQEELNKLRNPWISAEERLPEEDEEVIGMSKRGWAFLIWRNGNKWCGKEYRALLCPDITHWMPIPQIEKGE